MNNTQIGPFVGQIALCAVVVFVFIVFMSLAVSDRADASTPLMPDPLVEEEDVSTSTPETPENVEFTITKKIAGPAQPDPRFNVQEFQFEIFGGEFDGTVDHGETVSLPADEYDIEEAGPDEYDPDEWSTTWSGTCTDDDDDDTDAVMAITEDNLSEGSIECVVENTYDPQDSGDDVEENGTDGDDTEGDETFLTVILQLIKKFSGTQEGFEQEQFSFLVSGDNDVDTEVAHEDVVELLPGAYSITEIVPDGFNPADWTIQWSGECNNMTAPTGTITVDEDDPEHYAGTEISCWADNQYKPDNGNDGNDDGDDEGDGGDDGNNDGDNGDGDGNDNDGDGDDDNDGGGTIHQYTLTVTTVNATTTDDEASGTVTGEGISCDSTLSSEDEANDCTETYDAGTEVELTVTPGEDSSFSESWTIGAGSCTGTATPCTITMNQDVDVTAHFSIASSGDDNDNSDGRKILSSGSAPTGDSFGSSGGVPTPQVAGASITPVGAANAGAGGTSSPYSVVNFSLLLLSVLLAGAGLKLLRLQTAS